MRVSAIFSALCALVPSLAFAAQVPLSSQQHGKPSALTGNDHILPIETLHELLTLHRELVKIESISGNEYRVGWWLVSYLKENGFNVEVQYVGEAEQGENEHMIGGQAQKRFNVFAWPGEKKFTKVLVSSHIDTVPPYIPYSFDTKKDEIWGRGTVDAKGSVAAQVIAVKSLLANSSSSVSADDVSLLFVVGEETGGEGMRSFSNSSLNPGNYSAVVFGEPTESKLVAGHKGMLAFDINVKGKAAHSGYPWLGLSANNVLVEALGIVMALEAGRVNGAELRWSEKYGNTTLNIGKISGGVARNVVAKEANAGITGRLAAGTPDEAKDALLKALSPVITAAEKAGGEVTIEFGDETYGPVDMSCDVEGFECITVNYGTDIPRLKGDHKRYLYGPGSILVAHSDNEAIKVHDLERAVVDYTKLISVAVEN
ncbi:uncharacterized protein K452DRAFT_271375 [Aplosporella prunicola CBS 121167]|uniref:Peptidase M20 dimerisation domain-containing protein n=1 Tax=Aplosporella prunicola CBS 121167 TaxID=1176127 RepID=A0A6A6BBT8_9PEZI|nr:uncharacterized protein K452DRAFT_271375 [Aplosporella prunicola CBS 121167]KAF2141702.1 hypothetical protein K452DRAFT_271375 [Aplosporella prunicola CBS 121167]